MLVSEAIEQVRDDTLETSAAGLATDARVIRCLNEGLRHLHGIILRHDLSGQWLGQEATYTYPAGSRWVDLANWTGTAAPNRIISLVDATNNEPIEIADARGALRGVYRGATGRLVAHIQGSTLGLRRAGTDEPPSDAVAARMVFVPPVVPITDADLDKDIGTDFPFPADCAEAVVAYAVVRLVMQTEAPLGDFKGRYNQLEQDLIEMLQSQRQTFTLPTVGISNPWWC